MEKNKTEISLKKAMLKEFAYLFLKIGLIVGIFTIVFTLLFGAYRDDDNGMKPAIKSGDLVIYYKYDKIYVASEAIVVKYKGQTQVRRVVAIEGDVVDITKEGLTINGALQEENNIYYDTLLYRDGNKFPLTVGKKQVFVLGDNREEVIDSRMYGCIDVAKTEGKVITVIRTRGL